MTTSSPPPPSSRRSSPKRESPTKSLPSPPRAMSSPSKPSRRSLPGPPSRTSLPLTPKRRSLPSPPSRRSLPDAPSSSSSPASPKSWSLAEPPERRSLPAPPKSWSREPCPRRMSFSGVPRSVSGSRVPSRVTATAVAGTARTIAAAAARSRRLRPRSLVSRVPGPMAGSVPLDAAWVACRVGRWQRRRSTTGWPGRWCARATAAARPRGPTRCGTPRAAFACPRPGRSGGSCAGGSREPRRTRRSAGSSPSTRSSLLAEGERWSVSGLCGRIWTLTRDYPRLDGPDAFRAWDEPGTVRVLLRPLGRARRRRRQHDRQRGARRPRRPRRPGAAALAVDARRGLRAADRRRVARARGQPRGGPPVRSRGAGSGSSLMVRAVRAPG